MQLLYDGAETVVAGNAEASLRGLIGASVAELMRRRRRRTRAAARRRGVEVVPRVLFNPTLDGVPYMVAGTFGFVLTFLTTLITAVSIVNERLQGTFEQLQVTPATSLEIFLGKVLPLGAVFAVDVVLMVLAAGLLMHVWPHGSALFFVAVSSFYVLTSLALGLIISATSATAAEAVQKTVLTSIPLVQLSGFAFPIRNMPLPVQWLAEIFPGDALHPRQPRHLPARRGAARSAARARAARRCSARCWSPSRCAASRRGMSAASRRASTRRRGSHFFSNVAGDRVQGGAARCATTRPFWPSVMVQPIVMLLLFGFALSNKPANVPWAVLDHSRTRGLAPLRRRRSQSTGYFLPPRAVASYARGTRAAASAATALAFVVIPADFRRDVERGAAPQVQLLLDGTDPLTAARVGGSSRAVGASFDAPGARHARGRARGTARRRSTAPALLLQPDAARPRLLPGHARRACC